MTGQLKEVFGIYENDRRQQGAGKIVVEIMTKADHAAMHELARLDIERIAQAAGAAMPKNACIVARRSVRQQQETGIKQLNEMLQEIDHTFHPTQKPIRLYEWVIANYAAAGDKILDTHAGSGACLRAAYRTGHNFLGFEIDKEYFTEADKRLREEMAQMRFDFLFGGGYAGK